MRPPQGAAVSSPATLSAQSEDKRNDAFGSSPIIRIPLGELLQHQFFFVAKFNPETRKHQECAYKPGQVSLRERGSKEHGEYPGVDLGGRRIIKKKLNQFGSFF